MWKEIIPYAETGLCILWVWKNRKITALQLGKTTLTECAYFFYYIFALFKFHLFLKILVVIRIIDF